MWQIWKSRNNQTFNKQKEEANDIMEKAITEWVVFDKANKDYSGKSINQTVERTPIPENREEGNGIRICYAMKINQILKQVSYCIHARDHRYETKLVWAATKNREGCLPIEEANIIKLVMALARQKRWTEISIQGTNRKLLQKMQRKEIDMSNCATIMENVLDVISLFSKCSFHVV